MNADQVNAKIYAGRGKAALRLGRDFGVYRPIDATDPLTSRRRSIKASMNAGDNTYRNPNMPGDAYWYADMDGAKVKCGDYLKHCDEVFFVAGLQPLLPIVVVECNRSVRLTTHKQATTATKGAAGYSGACASPDETTDLLGKNPASNGGTFVGWPASVLLGSGKWRSNILPNSAEQQGWRVLLPSSVPVVVQAGQGLTDDLGRNYMINAAELTDFGWRINAIEVHV